MHTVFATASLFAGTVCVAAGARAELEVGGAFPTDAAASESRQPLGFRVLGLFRVKG
jgi:hypothetical protein